MKQKDKRKIKKLLIDSMAFLEVGAYTGVYEACDQVTTIIDVYDENKEDKTDYGDPDYEDEDDYGS